MSSVIAPEPRAKCRGCQGKKFKPVIYDKSFDLAVHVCRECGDYPAINRLRRSLPIGIDGESVRVDIRYNRMGQRVNSVEEFMHMARSIDYDLRDGRFDPNDYRSSMSKDFHYENVLEKYYIPHLNKKFGVNNWPNKKVYIGHLKKFFSGKDVRKIKHSNLKEFQLIYNCGERSKDLTIQEMSVQIDFFFDLGIITSKPTIPKTSQSRERKIKEFITKDEQQFVLSLIEDEYYHDIIEILCIYALRPGDIRALKWKDINFHENTFTIDEHFAKAKLKDARKSVEEELVLPMTDRFIEIISKMPHSINGEEFVFKARNNQGGFTSGALGEKVLNDYWKAACEKAFKKKKVSKIVPLYLGTKSTSLTSYLNEGNIAKEELVYLTGHTSTKTLSRYAKETDKTKVRKVRNILTKESKAAHE